MSNIVEISDMEIGAVDGAGSGTSAYEDGKQVGQRVAKAIEDFIEGMWEVWTDGK